MRYWDIHADDYGLSLGASEDILKCIAKNALDSISVLTNMPDCGKYAALVGHYVTQKKLHII